MVESPSPKTARGNAKIRLLEAARDLIRRQGYSATTVDELCEAAKVTKGAFFHRFKTKEALGIAAAEDWGSNTSALFEAAPYHRHPDPLDRVLAYIDFRRSMIEGDVAEWTCLVGTMTQELYRTSPEIRDACAASIFDHADTLSPDIQAAIDLHGFTPEWTPASLSEHIQAVLQGAFILAKASVDPDVAIRCIDHLRRYVELLFNPIADQE